MNNSDTPNSYLKYPSTSTDIIKEAKMVVMPLSQKNEYIQEFINYIHISNFIGNYSFPFFFIGITISVIVIVVLVSTIENMEGLWFGVWVAISVVGILALTLLGYLLKRRSAKVKLELLIDYIFYRLVLWTNKKLKKSKNINEKRIFMENLISIFYDYSKFKEVKLWYRDPKLSRFYCLIDAPENQSIIEQSLYLFNLFYINSNQTYNEKGVLLVVKIFLPILNISNNPHICNSILNLIKKFMKDTRMNVFKSKVVNRVTLNKNEMVLVTKHIFKKHGNFLDLFEKLWEGCVLMMQKSMTIKSEIQKNDVIEDHLEDIRGYFENNRINGYNNDRNIPQRLDSFAFLKNSPDMKGRDLITQNNPFGFNSTLLNELMKKVSVEKDNNRRKQIIRELTGGDYRNLEEIEQLIQQSEANKKLTHKKQPEINSFRDKEENEKLFHYYATCETQNENPVNNIEIEQDEDNKVINKNVSNKVSIDQFSAPIKSEKSIQEINQLPRISVLEQNEIKGETKCENEDDFETPVIRLSVREMPTKRKSFALEKRANDSLINIIHYEIPEVKTDEKNSLSKEIDTLLSIATEPTSSFKLISSKEGIIIYQKHSEGSPVVLVRCDAIVNGNVEDVFEAIFNLEKRSQWDSVFSRLRILKVFDENTDVMYSYLKAPPMVTNRDFLQKRCYKRNISNFDIVVAFVSYEDKDFPPIKNTIRANTIISGYAFKKIDEDKTQLVTVSQTDIKGSIPVWIINKTAAKAPYDWVRRLEKAVKNFNDLKLNN